MDLGDVWRLDATAQASLVRDGQVTPAELLDAAISRIERLNPEINGVITPLYERARAQAAAPLAGPFAGVPMLVKDACLQIEGTPYYLGTRVLHDLGYQSSRTTELARRFERAGFVILGKTNVPPMSGGVTTEPLTFGPTRNPWDLARSAGGSSGGSAAAVASGMISVAHGSDATGSLRYPASVCGLVTLKPSRGRVPSETPTGEADAGGIWAEFVLARSVRDLAGVLDAVHNPNDGSTFDAAPPSGPFVNEIGRRRTSLRVGVMTDDVSSRMTVDAECVRAVERTADVLTSLGHHVDDTHPPALDDLIVRIASVLGVQIAAARVAMLRWISSIAGRAVEPAEVEIALATGWNPSQTEGPAPEQLAAANELVAREIARVASWWDEGPDLLITPTTRQPAWPLGGATAFDVGTFPYVWSMNGQPAISVPMHWTPAGLPCGVQIVAAPGRDDVLLDVAAQLEETQPWADRWPAIALA